MSLDPILHKSTLQLVRNDRYIDPFPVGGHADHSVYAVVLETVFGQHHRRKARRAAQSGPQSGTHSVWSTVFFIDTKLSAVRCWSSHLNPAEALLQALTYCVAPRLSSSSMQEGGVRAPINLAILRLKDLAESISGDCGAWSVQGETDIAFEHQSSDALVKVACVGRNCETLDWPGLRI